MKNKDTSTYKLNIFSRLGLFISTLGVLYESKGFVGIYKYILSMIKIEFCKWKYEHCRKYREKIYNNAKEQNSTFPIILDMFVYNKVPSIDEIYEKLNDEERKSFNETFEKVVEKHIKEGSISDAEEIKKLRDYVKTIKV